VTSQAPNRARGAAGSKPLPRKPPPMKVRTAIAGEAVRPSAGVLPPPPPLSPPYPSRRDPASNGGLFLISLGRLCCYTAADLYC